MSRIAIVGSRGYPSLKDVRDFMATLPKGTVIVSGAASGVDAFARHDAAEFGFMCIEVHPAWNTGKGAGLARNTVIAEIADEVVAFWDGESRGTMDTVRKARAMGKPVRVFEWKP